MPRLGLLFLLTLLPPPSAAYVHYFDGALVSSEVKTTEAMAVNLFEQLSESERGSLWMDMASLHHPRSELEHLISHLLGLARTQFAERGSAIKGAEVWVQGRLPPPSPEATLGFHYDKDETLATRTGRMHHPHLSSILYLTDNGGPTMIVNQTWDHDTGPRPAKPTDGGE